MFEYKIEELLSTHSFGRFQISVVTMSDRLGKLHNGIAVYPIPIILYSEARYIEAIGSPGKPLVIDEQQSLQICKFIEDVLNNLFPKRIVIKSSGLTLRIQITKYTNNWHGGGGYKGNVGFCKFNIFNLLPKAIISRNSLIKLKNSLVQNQ